VIDMVDFWNLLGLPAIENPKTDDNIPKNLTDYDLSNSFESKGIVNISSSKLPDPDWNQYVGPRTPDGWPLHDLGDDQWRVSFSINSPRIVRHVLLTRRFLFDHELVQNWLADGDIVLLNLNKMRHLSDAQEATRRALIEFSEEASIPIYVVDEHQELLLIPGAGVVVDGHDHELGISLNPFEPEV